MLVMKSLSTTKLLMFIFSMKIELQISRLCFRKTKKAQKYFQNVTGSVKI